jgi:hypothetical protein
MPRPVTLVPRLTCGYQSRDYSGYQAANAQDPSTYADVNLAMTFSALTTHTALTAATPHNIDGGRNQQFTAGMVLCGCCTNRAGGTVWHQSVPYSNYGQSAPRLAGQLGTGVNDGAASPNPWAIERSLKSLDEAATPGLGIADLSCCCCGSPVSTVLARRTAKARSRRLLMKRTRRAAGPVT